MGAVLGGAVFLAVFLGGGGYGLVRAFLFAGRAQQVPGVITGHRSASPIVYFDTLDGRRVRSRSRLRTKPARFHVGERVTVLYDPRDPGKAIVRGWRGSRLIVLLILLFLFIGLVGVAVTSYVVVG